MSDIGQKESVAISCEVMIFDIAGEEGVGALLDSLFDERCPRAAADGDLPDHDLGRTGGVSERRDGEEALDVAQKLQSGSRADIADDSEAVVRVAGFGFEHFESGHAQAVGDLIADAFLGAVEIGMGGIDRQVAAERLDDNALRGCGAGDMLEGME